jgi:hypothetical protein
VNDGSTQVLSIWATDTVHEVLITGALYEQLVLDFGNITSLACCTKTVINTYANI